MSLDRSMKRDSSQKISCSEIGRNNQLNIHSDYEIFRFDNQVVISNAHKQLNIKKYDVRSLDIRGNINNQMNSGFDSDESDLFQNYLDERIRQNMGS